MMPILRVIAGLIVLAALSSATQADDGLKPGDVLDQNNWQKAEGLLPPEILKHYKTGEYVNRIVDYPLGSFRWPPEFVEASKQNAGRFDLSPEGGLIDKATGKQPTEVFGYPFPTVDAKDPQAGVKIVWNYFYLTWYWGNLHAQAQVNFVTPKAMERRTEQDVNWMIYDGVPKRERMPNAQNFLMQNLIVVKAPADLSGTAALTWRYRDSAKRDSAWTFVPALRRVRAISPANRSDGFLGSDMAQDDGAFFDGKPEDFTWTLKGEADQFRIVDPLNLKGEGRADWLPGGGWRSFWPDVPYLGYQDPTWKGVGWAPIAMALATRRFWVVDGVPKDKYYLFGRLELYVDKETFQGSWNRKFNWQGELLNTFQVVAYNPLPYKRPDGGTDYNQASNMNFQCAEAIKQNRATVAGQKWNANAALDGRVPFEPAFFDMNALSRFGK